MLPRGPHGLSREAVEASQRGRLLVAFAEATAEKGYYGVTVQDIVTRAGTAKRTFYAFFRDKEDCFVQAFDLASATTIAAIVEASDAAEDPIDRIRVGVRAYLDSLAQMPEFTQVFLNHARSAGPLIAEHWSKWLDLLSDAVVTWRRESRAIHPEMPELSKDHALIVIAGINEFVREALQENGFDALAQLGDTVVPLAVTLLTADPAPR